MKYCHMNKIIIEKKKKKQLEDTMKFFKHVRPR